MICYFAIAVTLFTNVSQNTPRALTKEILTKLSFHVG